MKKLKYLGFLFGLFFLTTEINAQTFTWNGLGATNNFSENGNWVGGIAPNGIGGESVVFDATSTKSCVLDFPGYVLENFNINAGYSSVFTCGGNDLTITGNYSQATGTFIASSDVVFFQNETSAGAMTITRSGGSFQHNNGIVELVGAPNSTITFVGTYTLNDLKLSTVLTNNAQRTIDFGTNIRAVNLDISGSRPFGFKGLITLSNSLLISNTSITTFTPTGSTATFSLNSGASPFTITGSNQAGRCKLPNITFSTSAVPVMSNHISLTGTWNNIQSGNLAAGGTSTVNFYGATSAIVTHTAAPATVARRAKFHNLTIHPGSNVTMGNRHWIEVSKNLTIDGNFITTNQSGIHFDGPNNTTQNLTGSAGSFTIGSLLKSNNTSTVVLGFNLTVLDSVKFVSSATVSIGKINTNGNFLILPSSSTLKARISTVGNGTIAVVNNIIGNIRVQTFAPGGFTGWTNLGVSGVQGQTFNNWYGQIPMSIEGSTTGVTSAGGYYFESVQGWDETDSYGYDSTITVSSPLNVGQGYWVYLGNGATNTTDMNWTVSGSPVQGTVTIPLTRTPAGANPGYNLISNPYACPVKLTNLMAIGSNSSNITNVIYVYNPDLGVTSEFNGVNGITNPSGSGATNIIPMGQAFYVEANSSSNLVFTERAKCNNNTTNQLLKSSTVFSVEPGDTVEPAPVADTYDVGPYFRLNISGNNSDYDETVLHFHPQADNFYEKHDARKIFTTPGYVGYPGVYSKYTTISTRLNNEDYSINSLKTNNTTNYQIPVLVKVMSSGTYTIAPMQLNNLPANVCATLHDKLLNVTHDLYSGPYVCNISDTTSTPRFMLSVCPVANITSVANNNYVPNSNIDISKDFNGIFTTLSFDKVTDAKITVTNILGQSIINPKNVRTISDKIYLDINTNDQLIFVTVETSTERVTKKFVNIK